MNRFLTDIAGDLSIFFWTCSVVFQKDISFLPVMSKGMTIYSE